MAAEQDGNREAEQIQIARAIGEELTDIFVAYVRGRVSFDELTFGMFDVLSDLHAVASGEYELEADDGDDHDHHEHDHEHDYDEEEATDEQEDLSQEPVRNGGK